MSSSVDVLEDGLVGAALHHHADGFDVLVGRRLHDLVDDRLALLRQRVDHVVLEGHRAVLGGVRDVEDVEPGAVAVREFDCVRHRGVCGTAPVGR